MWRALTRMIVNRLSRILNTGFQYTPVLSIATCVHPTQLSQSPSCSNSSVIVAKVRISLRPLLIRHATTILACTSKPQQHSYTTSIASSFRPWRESRVCQRVCSACSPRGWQQERVPENGSRIRLRDGLRAPRLVDLCLTRTGCSIALGCLFFIGAGEARPHNWLRAERTLGNSRHFCGREALSRLASTQSSRKAPHLACSRKSCYASPRR